MVILLNSMGMAFYRYFPNHLIGVYGKKG